MHLGGRVDDLFCTAWHIYIITMRRPSQSCDQRKVSLLGIGLYEGHVIYNRLFTKSTLHYPTYTVKTRTPKASDTIKTQNGEEIPAQHSNKDS